MGGGGSMDAMRKSIKYNRGLQSKQSSFFMGRKESKLSTPRQFSEQEVRQSRLQLKRKVNEERIARMVSLMMILMLAVVGYFILKGIDWNLI